MAEIITLTDKNGKSYQFVNEVIASGAMKDVYFSPDKSYVVAFYRTPQDQNSQSRLENIIDKYSRQLFDVQGGESIHRLFCWPEAIVEWDKQNQDGLHVKLIGIVMPTYNKEFFFDSGRFKGKEKEGKWFASAMLRNRFLSDEDKGDWIKYFLICIKIARAVKKMHAAGLAHSDLSYKNILVNPKRGDACIIDIDGLVVPGKFAPDVAGTPDFIAPEVLETVNLKMDDPAKKLPCIATDRHALAVLIYMYLLYRHPLRGRRVCSTDPGEDEQLSMGREALFIENPDDKSNLPLINENSPDYPQGDPAKLPYTICGPYLVPLFNRAFIDGLHNPAKRPSADEWERALLATLDLLQPCQNPACKYKWFVFSNTAKPKCPFCGTDYKGDLPMLDLYYRPGGQGSFRLENRRIMVYAKQSLYKWHTDWDCVPSEKLNAEDQHPVGDFQICNGKWMLINRRLKNCIIMKPGENSWQPLEPNNMVELTNDLKIVFDKTAAASRLALVKIVSN